MQPSGEHPRDAGGDGAPRTAESGPGRLSHPTDLRLSIFILAACAGLYYMTTRFEQVADLFAQDVPPQFFPRLLIWTIVVLAVLMPFEHLHLRRRNSDIDAHRRDTIKPVAFATAALLCLVVAATAWIGAWLAMTLACLTLPPLWGERRLKVVLPFAILFPSAVVLLFSYGLSVYIEPGRIWSALN